MNTCAPQFERVGDGLLVRAPAKLNLSLLITGKRPDGFHELETIMAKIDWYDEVLIQPAEHAGVELVCRGPEWAPDDESNLVYRAARQILGTLDQPIGVRLTLTKNIPAGSGLGSASSNAAATLLGLNRYLDLRLPDAQLAEMAGQLGSDVPFFLTGPLAFCTGKGEKVEQISQTFEFAALLIIPSVSVATKKVYAHYAHDPDLYERLRRDIRAHMQENRVDLVTGMCANMLQRTCFHLFENLSGLKGAIESLGAGPVCLSGSGSAMFVILGDHDSVRLAELRDKVTRETGSRTIVVSNNRW